MKKSSNRTADRQPITFYGPGAKTPAVSLFNVFIKMFYRTRTRHAAQALTTCLAIHAVNRALQQQAALRYMKVRHGTGQTWAPIRRLATLSMHDRSWLNAQLPSVRSTGGSSSSSSQQRCDCSVVIKQTVRHCKAQPRRTASQIRVEGRQGQTRHGSGHALPVANTYLLRRLYRLAGSNSWACNGRTQADWWNALALFPGGDSGYC